MTDGCHYYFFGDLENPNQMDRDPFFSFFLDDPKTDWAKVAKFLAKFSRDSFNAETLVTDAENARYRQAMIDKLSAALRAPLEDEGFVRWLSDEVYKGNRTKAVMTRMSEIAKDAIEPALLRVIGDDFLNKLKERIHKLNDGAEDETSKAAAQDGPADASDTAAADEDGERAKSGIDTTSEELEFYDTVKAVCIKNGFEERHILYKDTVNYFNVSTGSRRSGLSGSSARDGGRAL